MVDYCQQSTPISPLLRKARQSTDSHASPIALIHALDPDILSAIFYIIAQDAEWGYQSYVPQVSHVCSYWRSVALDTPQLWNHFRIRLTANYNNHWISECRRRARSIPLHIDIYMDKFSNQIALISAEPIHQAFPDFRLIETLTISANVQLTQEILKVYTDITDPNIRYISISSFPSGLDQWTSHDDWYPFKTNGMPHLESLQLHGCSIGDWGLITSFHSLKILRISPSHSISLDIFSVLPHLEELSVHFDRYNFSFLGSDRIIYKEACFQLLKTFSLSTPYPSLAVRTLEFLSFPSCTTFNLSMTCRHTDSLESTLADLLSTLSRLVTGGMALSSLPVHRLEVSPAAIEAIAWNQGQDLPIEDIKIPGWIRRVRNMKDIDEQRSMYFSLHFFGPGRHIAPPKSLLSRSVIRPLANLFNIEHLRFLSWEHFDAAFTNAKLELGNEFFYRTTELRSIEVETAFTDFLGAIAPTTNPIHAPVGLSLHEEESPSIWDLPQPCTLPLRSGPFLTCPNLSDIKLVLPDRYRGGKLIDEESFFSELTRELKLGSTGNCLETLRICCGSRLNKEKIPDSVLLRLQEVAREVVFLSSKWD
ncbi:hypothetical protein AX16_004807 [Volvariella volvacea WC 439]|nr:hypothetical protein AX16_004807 [Volvariella volvacea WC 439]